MSRIISSGCDSVPRDFERACRGVIPRLARQAAAAVAPMIFDLPTIAKNP